MKILYLTFFESVIRNGIYETQVKEVLCKLATKYGNKVAISHFALLPAVRIGRKGISVFLLDERQELANLEKEYRRHGVAARCIFLPFITLRRWGAQLSLSSLALLTVFSFPLLAFRIARQRPDIIHCRSYMATVIALSLKLLFPELRVVFDPRGFWPEEGIVEGKWRENSLKFRLWKKIEKYLFRRSEKVIALSESFADHVHDIHPQTNCAVIYTSVHVEKFKEARRLREQRRQELGFGDSKVFVYNGSLGTWHDPVLLAQIYRSLRQTLGDTKLLVITTHNKEKLEAVFQSNGLFPEEFLIMVAKPHEVPGYLAAADYGIVPLRDISKPGPMTVVADTMIGTKVAEYLASGLPIVANRRVGGIRSLMASYKIGLFFDSNDLQGMLDRFADVLKHYGSYQADCEQVADRYFSLDQVARGYFEVYKQLVGRSGTGEQRIPVPCAKGVAGQPGLTR